MCMPVYRIKWKHPKSKRASIGPILIHTFTKTLYTKEEAEAVCDRYNNDSKVVHSI